MLRNMKPIYIFIMLSFWFKVPYTEAKIPCDPDSFQFVIAKSRIKYTGSYVFQVTNREEIGCAINASYLWELFRIKNNKLYHISPNVLLINSITRSTKNVINFDSISKKEDIFGNQYLLRVTLIPPPTHYESYRVHHLTVEEEDYNLEIEGGKKQIHYMGTGSLWLNVSYKRETGRKFEYKSIEWYCFPIFEGDEISTLPTWKVHEKYLRPDRIHKCSLKVILPNNVVLKATQEVEIVSFQTPPVLEIVCVDNCQGASSLMPTILKYNCHKICNGTPAWTIYPYDLNIVKKFQFSADDPTKMVIPPLTIEQGLHYKIMLILGNEVANYTVSYKMGENHLKLQCIQNCYVRSKEIVLQAQCTAGLFEHCPTDLYIWKINPYPENWNWTQFKYVTNQQNLSFPPLAFPLESGAVVQVQNRLATAYLDFTVTTLPPEIKLECVSKCTYVSSMALVTIRVICLKDCYDVTEYTWSLTPVPENYDWNDHTRNKSQIIDIPGDSYQPSTIVQVTVRPLGFTNNVSISVNYEEAANISINCTSDCFSPVGMTDFEARGDESIILEALCTGACEGVKYTWSYSTFPTYLNKSYENKLFKVMRNTTAIFFPAFFFHRDTTEFSVKARTHGNSSAEITIGIKNQYVMVEIICILNCKEYSDPERDVVLKAICRPYVYVSCSGQSFYWAITPDYMANYWYDKVQLSFQNVTITILANSYNSYDEINVTLMTKPIYSFDEIKIRYKWMPHLILTCVANCDPMWSHKHTIITVKCSKNCENLKYSWEIRPTNNISLSETDLDRPDTFNITLPYNEFLGKMVLFVNASNADNFASRNLELFFKIKVPNKVIECTPTPCSKIQNRQRRVNLHISCGGPCDPFELEWYLDPVPMSFSWEQYILLSLQNLSILPKAFPHHYETYAIAAIYHEEINLTQALYFEDPQPNFWIECIINCNHSDPYLPVTFRALCEWQCEYIDSYNWIIEPPPTNFMHDIKLSPKHMEMIIRARVYKDGDIIKVTSSWSVYNRTLKISFVEQEAVLNIVCLRNCQYNVKDMTYFQVICEQFCTAPDEYTWTANPGRETNFFSHKGHIFGIPPLSYPPNNPVEIIVCKKKGCANFEFNFKPSDHVLELQCISNCDSNYTSNPSIPVDFEVTCLENCDKDMTYEWKIDPEPFRLLPNVHYVLDNDMNNFMIKENIFANESCANITARSNEVTVGLKICFIKPFPKLAFVCRENCGYPDPESRTIYILACSANCQNLKYKWSLKPSPRKNTLYLVKPTVVIIRKKHFRDKDTTALTCLIDNILMERQITFASKPPAYSIACYPSCINADPKRNITLYVVCVERCKNNSKFEWQLTPIPPDFYWSVNVSTSTNNDSLVIHANTYSNNSAVTVTVSDALGSSNSHRITYIEQPILLDINCVGNCYFDPNETVSFTLTSYGYEHLLNYAKCFLKPSPNIKKEYMTLSDGDLFINPDVYNDGDKVVLNCSVDIVSNTTLIHYQIPVERVQCAIQPLTGKSGYTKHIVECNTALRDTTYHVFQAYPGLELSMGMKLWNDIHPYMPSIYLGPGLNTTLGVYIRVKDINRRLIVLYVNSLDFLEENINGTVRVLNEEWHNNIGEMFKSFRKALSFNQINNALQFAFILETSLSTSSEYIYLNIRVDVLQSLLSMSLVADPEQLLLFVEIVQLASIVNLEMLLICIDIVEVVIKRLPFLYPTPEKTQLLHNLTLIATGKILARVKSYAEPIIKNMNDPLRTSLSIQTSHQLAEIAELLTKITLEIINILNIIMDQSKTSERIVSNHIIITASYKPITLNKIVYDEYIPDSASFIEVAISILRYEKDMKRIEFKTVIFNPNLFWWHPDVKDEKAELLMFRSTVIASRIVYSTRHVVIKLFENKKMTNFSGNFFEYPILYWAVRSPGICTVLIYIGGTNITFVFTPSRPNFDFIKDEGYKINGNGENYSFLMDPAKVYYLGLVGAGEYILYTYAMRCLFWDNNFNNWSFDECVISSRQPEGEFIACDCPNDGIITAETMTLSIINVSEVGKPFHEQLRFAVKSMKIFAFFLFSAVPLILLVAFCEKKFKRRQSYVFVKDNFVSDKYVYVIIVQTSMRQSAGTTAIVSIQLCGTKHDSRVHLLNFDNKSVLQRNCTDHFVILTPAPLGTIKYIRLWHDMNGNSPDWFCNAVMVKNIKSGKNYTFYPYRWFSVHHSPWTCRGKFKYSKKRMRHLKKFKLNLETGTRTNISFYPFLAERTRNRSITKNLVITFTTILVILTTVLLLKFFDRFSQLFEVLIASACGLVTSVFFDALFTRSREEIY